jgi:hypothetical protein
MRLGIVDKDGSLAGLASLYRRQNVDVVYRRDGGRVGNASAVIATNESGTVNDGPTVIGGNIAISKFEASPVTARA